MYDINTTTVSFQLIDFTFNLTEFRQYGFTWYISKRMQMLYEIKIPHTNRYEHFTYCIHIRSKNIAGHIEYICFRYSGITTSYTIYAVFTWTKSVLKIWSSYYVRYSFIKTFNIKQLNEIHLCMYKKRLIKVMQLSSK